MQEFTFKDIATDTYVFPSEFPYSGQALKIKTEWTHQGVAVLKNFLPESLMDAYSTVREALNQPGGWKCDTPYLHVQELRDLALYRPLMEELRVFLGEEAGLHLNLTGWVSTERKWHTDTYLNPAHVGPHYAAVWSVLEDIHPDSGPFQYVPGSHLWPTVQRDKLLSFCPSDWINDPSWPVLTQDALEAVFEKEIKDRGSKIETFLGKRGDVLIWHSNLLHRGSKPNIPGMMRKSLISHYSGINHREDMPLREKDENGSYYFVFPGSKL